MQRYFWRVGCGVSSVLHGPPPEQVAIFLGKICSFLSFSVALLLQVVSVEVCAVQHSVPTASGNVLKYNHTALLGCLLAVPGLMEVLTKI